MGEECCSSKVLADIKKECHGQIKEECQGQMLTTRNVEEKCCSNGLHDRKPFVCNIYNSHFGEDGSLVKHLRNHHGTFADGGTVQQQMRNVIKIHQTDTSEDYCSVQPATQPLDTTTMTRSAAQPSLRYAEMNANIALACINERNGSLSWNDMKTVESLQDKTGMKIPLSIETYGLRPDKEDGFQNAGCNREFSGSLYMLGHLVTASQISNKCEMHEISTDSAQNLDIKSQKHLEDEKRFQSIVPNKIVMETGRVDERRMKHNGKKICTMCNRLFRCDSQLRQHMRSHTGEKPFKCSMCGDRFTYKSSVKTHLRTRHGVSPYPCKFCDKSFTHAAILKTHMEAHSEEKYMCKICDKKFTLVSSVKTHMMRTHTGTPNFQCTVCDMKFIAVNSLKTHMRTHAGEILHQCAVCDKKFTDDRSLKKHMWIHNKEKLYLCSMCDKRFIRVSNLENHERTHTGQKPFKCTGCDKSFSDVRNMHRHARIHTGEKPYRCTICGKKFTQAYNFKVHMYMHNGVKPHQCTLCDKKFRLPADLKKHFRIHTGERPYQCKYCDKYYSNKKKHMETHNKEKQDQGTVI